MGELVLINISGEDKPGITSRVTRLLGDFNIDVLDVGQAVIHNHLSLSILINIPVSEVLVHEQVLGLANELELNVKFTKVTPESYEQWVGLQGHSRFILTLLARKIKAAHLAEVTEVIAESGLNIDNIVRLSGRVPIAHEDPDSKACVEFSLKGEPRDAAAFRARLMSVGARLDIDIAVQEDGIFRRHRRLVAFDMDSTLISTEVVDELAVLAGVGDEVKAVTERAMHGELDFKDSLRQRVALLKGLPESTLQEVGSRLPLMEGAEHLFFTLNKLGYKTAILSGGFTFFGEVLQRKLGVDYMYANELEIVDGKLTGVVKEPIVDAARKADLLRHLANKENISLEQCIAVGDGANDLAMLGTAGLGVAFHAKPIVRESAEHSISNLGLDSILYLMGIRDRDASRLT